YGQQKPVFVYRLVTYGTFEHKLHKTNVHKINLATEVIDKKVTAKTFTKSEAKNYLQPPVRPSEVESVGEVTVLDSVMSTVAKSHRDVIVSVQSQEEFVGEVLDEMTEQEKVDAEAALLSEVNRRKNRQPMPPPPTTLPPVDVADYPATTAGPPTFAALTDALAAPSSYEIPNGLDRPGPPPPLPPLGVPALEPPPARVLGDPVLVPGGGSVLPQPMAASPALSVVSQAQPDGGGSAGEIGDDHDDEEDHMVYLMQAGLWDT
ncbi:hypothetical protein HK405_015166, partial [Cladochytrium tenue]